MAEIRNYTFNFGYGRSLGSLNFATTGVAKLACAEIERYVPELCYG
jgi:hypothetical protein